MGTVFSVAFGDLLFTFSGSCWSSLPRGLVFDGSASPESSALLGQSFLPVSVTGRQPPSPAGVLTLALPGGLAWGRLQSCNYNCPQRPAPPWDSQAENVQGCHSLGPAKSSLYPAASRGTPRPTPYFPERPAHPWPRCGPGSQGMLRGSGSPGVALCLLSPLDF